MPWGCVQPSKGLGSTQLSGQRARPAGRSGICSLLVRRQLLISLQQYNVGKVCGL